MSPAEFWDSSIAEVNAAYKFLRPDEETAKDEFKPFTDEEQEVLNNITRKLDGNSNR